MSEQAHLSLTRSQISEGRICYVVAHLYRHEDLLLPRNSFNSRNVQVILLEMSSRRGIYLSIFIAIER